jgi:hypothetical protein
MFEEEFAKLPVAAPRPVQSLPGLSLRGAIPKAALFLPLIFLAFFAFIPLSIMHADPAMRLALGPTDTAQGHVVSNVSASACAGTASHRVTYAFLSKSGNEYRGAATLCGQSPYYSAQEGDAIEVKYLSSDPTLNALPGDARNQPPPFAVFFFMPVFFLVVFASLFWPSLRDTLQARRLFKNGRLATGKVVFVKKRASPYRSGMYGSSSAQVFIEFQSPGQEKREAVAACHNEWLINQLTPGMTVHIAYSGEKPADIALLDAYLR